MADGSFFFMQGDPSQNESEYKAILESIYSIGEALYSQMGNDSDDHLIVFKSLTELGRNLVGADRASFWKWDKKNHKLWTASATGVDKIVIPDDKGLVGKALKEKRVIITNDPYSEPEFNPEVDRQTGYLTMSVLVMPVADISGDYIGAFQIINKFGTNGFDTKEDIRKLSLAAFVCGMALESETFYIDSHFDKLTGIRNRMGFYSNFAHKYSDYIREGSEKPLSMFICDIDKYKSVNDTYGHNVGDIALSFVAGIMKKHTGSRGTVYRWGGDEFIAVLADTDLEGCIKTADAVRQEVKDTPFDGEGVLVNLSMSFGCALYDTEKTIEENIAAADGKLFTAKEGGRNRVCG